MKTIPSLSMSQINQSLAEISDWSLEDGGRSIGKIFEFVDFKQAMNFVNKVAEIAEAEKHHPNINIHDYNKINISLSTHDAEGLTEKDFKVAERIDSLNSDN